MRITSGTMCNLTHIQVLPYSVLLETLQMPTIRDLEDLIIDAIHQEVISGKLDQKEQQFDVEYTMGRDVEASTIEGMLVALQNWFVFRPIIFFES